MRYNKLFSVTLFMIFIVPLIMDRSSASAQTRKMIVFRNVGATDRPFTDIYVTTKKFATDTSYVFTTYIYLSEANFSSIEKFANKHNSHHNCKNLVFYTFLVALDSGSKITYCLDRTEAIEYFTGFLDLVKSEVKNNELSDEIGEYLSRIE